MVDLSLDFMGLPLKNPIIAASGPWSGDALGIQAAIDEGAGAVVTETIAQEIYPRPSQCLYFQEGGVFSTSLYGTLSLEQWETEFEKLRKKDCRIIASIHGGTVSESGYIARKVERMGADAVQLDLYYPLAPVNMNLLDNAEQLAELIVSVKKEIGIPLMVRLPHYVSDNAKLLRSLEKAGADGICTIESLRGISGVDIENAKPHTPIHSGYTGPNVRPITLSAIATLSQTSNLPVSAAGGIDGSHSAIEAFMLGAYTVQLGSAILLQGYEVIAKAVREISLWMENHNYCDMKSLRGKALNHLYPYGFFNQSNEIP